MKGFFYVCLEIIYGSKVCRRDFGREKTRKDAASLWYYPAVYLGYALNERGVWH